MHEGGVFAGHYGTSLISYIYQYACIPSLVAVIPACVQRVMRYVIVNQSQIISVCCRADCSSIWTSHIQWIFMCKFH